MRVYSVPRHRRTYRSYPLPLRDVPPRQRCRLRHLGRLPDQTRRVRAGPAHLYRSSPIAVRGFCSTCGSTLTMHYDATRHLLDVAVGTLDTPPSFRPARHTFCAAAVSWALPTDDLPRHREGPERPLVS